MFNKFTVFEKKGMCKMFCYKCGTQIDENAKFCKKCGAALNEDDSNGQTNTNGPVTIPLEKKRKFNVKLIGVAVVVLMVIIKLFLGGSSIVGSWEDGLKSI